ncbi:hypothetical protein KR074_002387 [Drosophila pseudoananassae]|nr:hypothetical protein KR074_002387 [Drosophila pseudoananassae]
METYKRPRSSSSSSDSDSGDERSLAQRRFNAYWEHFYNRPEGLPPWYWFDPISSSSDSDTVDEGFVTQSEPEWSDTEMDGPEMLVPEVNEGPEVGDIPEEMDDAAELPVVETEDQEPMESLD